MSNVVRKYGYLDHNSPHERAVIDRTAYTGGGVAPAGGTETVVVNPKRIREGHRLAASLD